ncbi:hypothetical protein [Thermococcus sp.]|uniref:hypothetical protein n=1 Tax=Thermococcus sp. TaxID=35749 RepID=UPI002617ADF4|nr:hypothetical protein [Thermococcus sp.]
MVSRKTRIMVLIIAIIMVMGALLRTGNERMDSSHFVGLCVRTGDGFSVLTDGKRTVGVYASLEIGRVYLVRGILLNTTRGLRMRPETIGEAEPTFPLDHITGAYWPSRGYSLLTPERVRLALPLQVRKGELVEVAGLWYGGRFYPINTTSRGFLTRPEDGMPWTVEGTVIGTGAGTILWNGSEEIVLYLPYGIKPRPGERIRVTGRTRFYSRLSLLVDSPDDVVVLGRAAVKPLEVARIGEIAAGECAVTGTGRFLRLNCTGLKLAGFSARTGDTVRFEALRRKSSLLCLNCTVTVPREDLPNGICSFSPGRLARISGKVSWVRIYRNGFGLANVTQDRCWVLLKLRKSLGASIETNGSVTAYGLFTTYRNMPALEIKSGDDLCSGNC